MYFDKKVGEYTLHIYYTCHHARMGRVEEVRRRGKNRSLSGLEHKNGKFQSSF